MAKKNVVVKIQSDCCVDDELDNVLGVGIREYECRGKHKVWFCLNCSRARRNADMLLKIGNFLFDKPQKQ